MEPESLVLANLLARLQFNDVARLFAQVATDVVVVVDLAQEADALRVLAMGWCQVFALGYFAHFLLHHVSDGEESLLQLPVVYLSQKVRLVLYGVRTGAEPFEGVRGAGG